MDLTLAAQTLLSGASAGGIYALVAIGFGVMYRTTRVFNFAQGDFGTLGAYITYTVFVTLGFPYVIGAFAGCLTVAAIAVIVERVALRPLYRFGEIYTFVSTIGLGLAIQSGVQQLWGAIPRTMPSVFGDQGVTVLGLRVVPQVVAALVISLALASAMYLFLMRTRLGVAMRASAQERRISWLLGIPVNRMYTIAFAIGGALGAAAGILLAPITVMSPTMGTSLGIPGFIAALVGGLGSMQGAVAGGLALGILQAFAVFVVDPRYRDIVVYGAFVLMILFRPSGLFGEEAQARRV